MEIFQFFSLLTTFITSLVDIGGVLSQIAFITSSSASGNLLILSNICSPASACSSQTVFDSSTVIIITDVTLNVNTFFENLFRLNQKNY